VAACLVTVALVTLAFKSRARCWSRQAQDKDINAQAQLQDMRLPQSPQYEKDDTGFDGENMFAIPGTRSPELLVVPSEVARWMSPERAGFCDDDGLSLPCSPASALRCMLTPERGRSPERLPSAMAAVDVSAGTVTAGSLFPPSIAALEPAVRPEAPSPKAADMPVLPPEGEEACVREFAREGDELWEGLRMQPQAVKPLDLEAAMPPEEDPPMLEVPTGELTEPTVARAHPPLEREPTAFQVSDPPDQPPVFPVDLEEVLPESPSPPRRRRSSFIESL